MFKGTLEYRFKHYIDENRVGISTATAEAYQERFVCIYGVVVWIATIPSIVGSIPTYNPKIIA